MTDWDKITFDRNVAVHAMARILIASYFMASALGLISSSFGNALFELILPIGTAQVTGAVLVVLTGLFIMVGSHIRVAALLLAVYVLASSFAQNYGSSLAVALDAFWLDLALVGGLLMTYSHGETKLFSRPASDPRRPDGRVPFARKTKIKPRRVKSRDLGESEREEAESRNIFA